MSTHATLAYKNKDGSYACKDIHWGAYDDVKFFLANATREDIIESVDKGDSSYAFAGFYLNEKHCIEKLNWTHAIWANAKESVKTRTAKTLKELHAMTSYVYVYDESKDGVMLSVYLNGRRIDELRFDESDGHGAIRDKFQASLKPDFGSWIAPNVYQSLSLDVSKRPNDKADIYLLLFNNDDVVKMKLEDVSKISEALKEAII